MGLDIIDIALENFTDDQEFESLATEVLYQEGFYGIKPMPGGNDFAQDAIEDKFFISDDTIRTVFQYSFQEYVGEYADSDPLIPREGDPTIPRQSDPSFPR